MAVNRTQQSGLTVALIVFVMLTFILAAATYFGFTGRQKALDDQAAAEKQAMTTANDLRQAQQDLEALRAVVGVPPNTPVADIETGLAAVFEGDFAGFDKETKSYMNLVGWLRDEFRDLSSKVQNAQGKAANDAARLQTELENAQKESADARAAAAKSAADARAAEADFTNRREQYENSLARLGEELDSQRDQATSLRKLEAEIAKFDDFKDLVSDTQRQSFLAADPLAKVGKAHDLIRDLQKAIIKANSLLAQLRVADPAAQRAIAATTAADDRIDGFDGRIVDVDPKSGTVLLASRSTAGLRPGLVLHVFDPSDPRPEFGNRKAVVQVTEIEGPTLARASIQRETTRDPILAGDGVSSSLWSAGTAPDIVIVGFADVDRDGRSDRESLAGLITRAGGRVQNEVTSGTALVVDLGSPTGLDIDRVAPDWPTESKRRDKALKDAEAYGIRIKGSADLLDMLGLESDAFAVGRFPGRRDTGSRLPPAR